MVARRFFFLPSIRSAVCNLPLNVFGSGFRLFFRNVPVPPRCQRWARFFISFSLAPFFSDTFGMANLIEYGEGSNSCTLYLWFYLNGPIG